MNALTSTVLVAMGRAFIISRDIDSPAASRLNGDDRGHGRTETAMAVFSLIVDPLSILGFPGRLSGGVAIPYGVTRTT